MAKILIVEDEMFVRELYERVLSQNGFEVFTASDGEKGLAIAASAHPDLILLDVMMPGVNGLEVLKRLKADSDLKDIPVVLLTNLGQQSVIQQALDQGASGYLMKVRLTPYQVLAHVKEFLQNPGLKLEPNPANFD
mgnify:CR=1 FL=1